MKYFLSLVIIIVAYVAFIYYGGQANASLSQGIVYFEAEILPFNDEVSLNNKIIAEKTTLTSGSNITTNATGRAIIKTGPQLITSIGENSEVKFTAQSELKESSFDVISGKLWSRLERALEQDEVYEVFTPTLAAAVRGTSFGTEVTENTDQITVIEGVVEVRDRNGTDMAQVKAGNSVVLVDGKLIVNKITNNKYNEWTEEHVNPNWVWGGAPEITLENAHRNGFWWENSGLISVEGEGFNQATKLEIDERPIPFVLVSDRLVQVPVSGLTHVREDSVAYIYLSNGEKVEASSIFVGNQEEVRKNLLW